MRPGTKKKFEIHWKEPQHVAIRGLSFLCITARARVCVCVFLPMNRPQIKQ